MFGKTEEDMIGYKFSRFYGKIKKSPFTKYGDPSNLYLISLMIGNKIRLINAYTTTGNLTMKSSPNESAKQANSNDSSPKEFKIKAV